jgi:hypothetical protein
MRISHVFVRTMKTAAKPWRKRIVGESRSGIRIELFAAARVARGPESRENDVTRAALCGDFPLRHD